MSIYICIKSSHDIEVMNKLNLKLISHYHLYGHKKEILSYKYDKVCIKCTRGKL